MLILKKNPLHEILREVRGPPRQGMLRASADSVDRKRFIVSSAESGGSAVGGVRPGEAGRAGDPLESCNNKPACAAVGNFIFLKRSPARPV